MNNNNKKMRTEQYYIISAGISHGPFLRIIHFNVVIFKKILDEPQKSQ